MPHPDRFRARARHGSENPLKTIMDPKIIPRAEHIISRKDIIPEALKVLYRLQSTGHCGYLAGGCVRDLLLHRTPKDFDVVTDAHPNRVRSLFRNCRLIGRRFRLAHVIYPNIIIEVATFRAAAGHQEIEQDGAAHNKGHALKTSEGMIIRDNLFGTPEEDALRRDFTINALFYNIADFSIIDYIKGVEDLNAGLVRSIGDPRVRFVEDPVRMIRAVRFASVLNFRIENYAYESIAALAPRLGLASPSRMYEEILKLMFCGNTARVYHHLRQTGLLAVLFPEFAQWLATPEGVAAQPRTELAFRTLDVCRQHGHPVSPALLFALIFGAYHESLARKMVADGMHPVQAGHEATVGHLWRLVAQIQIPKIVGLKAGDIMAVQPKLLERNRRDLARLPHRSFFPEALDYFGFVARAEKRNQDIAAEWARLLPRVPAAN